MLEDGPRHRDTLNSCNMQIRAEGGDDDGKKQNCEKFTSRRRPEAASEYLDEHDQDDAKIVAIFHNVADEVTRNRSCKIGGAPPHGLSRHEKSNQIRGKKTWRPDRP